MARDSFLRTVHYNTFHSSRVVEVSDGYAMLIRPNKAEAAVHGCHCPGDMAVRMRKVLVILQSCVV